MSETTIGDSMTEGRDKAFKSLAICAGMLVYVAGLLYSGVHNWRLMVAGVAGDLVIWAALGVVSLEISAMFLPLALHFWTHAPMQRIAAFAFYAVDLGLIILNVVIDYSTGIGTTTIPGWLEAYRYFGVPATPILAALGWSLLLLLDPSQRERAMVEALRASTREVLAARVAEQAKAADVGELVELAAANMTRDIVRSTLGVSAARALPENTIEGRASDPPAPARKQAPRALRWMRPSRPDIKAYNVSVETPGPERKNGREGAA